MGRVAEREEQANRDGLCIDLGKRREVERTNDTLRADALVDPEAALERNEWLRMALAQPVEVRSVLSPQVERCSNPLVATNAVRAPLRSRRAFVATVVPCVNRSISAASTARTAARTDSSCLAAVGTLAVRTRPSSIRTASVNVPPISTPRIRT